MLKVMRDSFQHLKWILVLIIVAFVVLVFVDWGAGGAGGPAAASDMSSVAARVNGDIITINEYRRALYFTQQRYEQMYGQALNEQMRKMLNLEQQVLNGLIDERLLLQEARKIDLEAGQDEVRKKILEIPVLNPDGKFIGADLYERYVLTSLNYPTVADFEQDLAREVTIGKMEAALASTVAITPQVAEEQYRRTAENAKIRYVLLPNERAMAGVMVSPEDVQKYYTDNSSKYLHGEQRHVKYLLADSALIRARLKLSDAELRQAYEQKKETFKGKEAVRAQHILIRVDASAAPADDAAAKAKAEGLVAQLRGGADFAALAKEHSGDPGSAVNGGDVGFFERGQMVPEFEQTAFSLPIGQISDPVKTQYGYHILKINEKRPAGYKPFEEVRGQLEMEAIDDRAKAQAREEIARVNTRISQSKPKDEAQIRALANQFVSFNDAKWIDKTGPVFGLGQVQGLTDWAFTAKAGDFGPIIDTQRGPIVPYLAELRPAGTTPLAEIRDRVENDVRQAKSRKAAQDMLASMLPVANLEELATRLGNVKAEEATLTREGYVAGLNGNLQPLVNAVMSANVGAIGGPVVVDNGAVVFQVSEQKKFDKQEYEKAKQGHIASLRQTEARKLRAALLSRLRKDADVEINEQLVPSNAPANAPATPSI